MPLWILVVLIVVAFFAVFCFFGNIAIFVEIGKAKKRMVVLEALNEPVVPDVAVKWEITGLIDNFVLTLDLTKAPPISNVP